MTVSSFAYKIKTLQRQLGVVSFRNSESAFKDYTSEIPRDQRPGMCVLKEFFLNLGFYSLNTYIFYNFSNQ